MKTFLRLLALAVIASAAALSSAGTAGAALPDCPAEINAVDASPPGYLRVGKSLLLEAAVSDGHVAAEISVLSASVGDQVVPLTLADGHAEAVFAGPAETGSVTVRFDWEQNLGTTSACHGSIVSELEAIPTAAKAGDPLLGRLIGDYELTVRRAGMKTVKGLWTLRPRCDVFGCSTMISNGGTASGHVLKPTDGHYRVKYALPDYGTCTLTYASGRKKKIRPAYHVSTSVDLRVTEITDGLATRSSGMQTSLVTPTARAQRAGCGRRTTTFKFKVTMEPWDDGRSR